MIVKRELIILLLINANITKGGNSPGVKSFNKCFRYNSLSVTKPYLGYIKRIKRHSRLYYSPLNVGMDALTGQLPFMAALGYKKYNKINYVCGGSLISNRFVLTVAHCVYTSNWGQVMYVRLGDLNLASKTDDIRVQEFHVMKYYVHPQYVYNIKYHDIALLMLDRPAIFCKQVAPACLETGRKELAAFELSVAGWGAMDYGESPSDHLQVGMLKEYSKKICRKAFPVDYSLPSGVDDESQICAGPITGFSDTCEGDSGGPLLYAYQLPEKTLYFLVGITSFGKPCSAPGIPSVYTRVSHYMEWIENITWHDENAEVEAVGILYHTTRILNNSANNASYGPTLFCTITFILLLYIIWYCSIK